jgi:hypothetical protein
MTCDGRVSGAYWALTGLALLHAEPFLYYDRNRYVPPAYVVAACACACADAALTDH